MIVIKVQLACISLVSLAGGTLAIAPVCLGFILGARCYESTSLQAPVYFTAAASILQVATQYLGIVYPYNILQLGAEMLGASIQACAGIYFLVMKMRIVSNFGTHWGIETAFIITWLLSLFVSIIVISYSLGALWLSIFGPEDDHFLDFNNSFSKHNPVHNSANVSDLEKPMPQFFSPVDHGTGTFDPVTDLGIPFGGPMAPSSPHFSFASSSASMRSGLDLNAGPKPLNTKASFGPSFGSSGGNGESRKSGVTDDANVDRTITKKTSSIFRAPKSPQKIKLSKSSFSLRRSPSKSERRRNSSASVSTLPLPETLHNTQPRTTDMSIGMPAAIGLPETFFSNAPHSKWVIVPNESVSESRSVSSSSQITGKIFPAAEYNRKINSAGFQREEPVPVQISVGRKLSQYELEKNLRIQKQSGSTQFNTPH